MICIYTIIVDIIIIENDSATKVSRLTFMRWFECKYKLYRMTIDWHGWCDRHATESEIIVIHSPAAQREIRKAEGGRSRKHLPIGIFPFSSLKSAIIAWTMIIVIVRSRWTAPRGPSWQSLVWSEDPPSTVPCMVVPWYRGASASIPSAIRVEVFECWNLPKRPPMFRSSYTPTCAGGTKRTRNSSKRLE